MTKKCHSSTLKCIIIETRADSIVVKSNGLGPVFAAMMHAGRLFIIVVQQKRPKTVFFYSNGICSSLNNYASQSILFVFVLNANKHSCRNRGIMHSRLMVSWTQPCKSVANACFDCHSHGGGGHICSPYHNGHEEGSDRQKKKNLLHRPAQHVYQPVNGVWKRILTPQALAIGSLGYLASTSRR
jgi:hypothetical protein